MYLSRDICIKKDGREGKRERERGKDRGLNPSPQRKLTIVNVHEISRSEYTVFIKHRTTKKKSYPIMSHIGNIGVTQENIFFFLELL